MIPIQTRPTADIDLPHEVERLHDLAYNLWWTWNLEAQELFARINQVHWGRYRNPVELLINVEPHEWERLLDDELFLSDYLAVIESFDRYLGHPESWWFQRHFPDSLGGPIAYFCAEYGLHESLGIYSGGLGVLAADHCKSASDLGLPFVGIGLLYKRGYFRQTIDADGNQQHFYPDFDPARLPLLPVVSPSGSDLRIPVDFPDRTVTAKLWKLQVGRIPVLLLDTNIVANAFPDRPITSILYVQGREMRLCQELVLGVGGVRALQALDIQPAVWHMNEGHSSLMGLERLRELVEDQSLPFDQAVSRVAQNTVLTTHTPVPAGNEAFEPGLVRKYFDLWCKKTGVSSEAVLGLGRVPNGNDLGVFNLTALGIRLSSEFNGVSRLHAATTGELWRGMWPDSPSPPIQSITNGVHFPTWLGRELRSVYERYLDPEWETHHADPEIWQRADTIPPAELWSAHLAQKLLLIKRARGRVREQYARHGRPPDALAAVEKLLDPNVLLIGFARRFATYKRADLVFRDLERIRSIVTDPSRPVHLIFAGKAHPADRPGQELIRHLWQLAEGADFGPHVVFLEDYDLAVARMLVQGVDVWLNTPRRSFEACGTSGMKAALNGALNLSVLDGWWDEAFDGHNGWAIGNREQISDSSGQDHLDAESLYHILADQVVPLYYARGSDGLPLAWIERVLHSIATIGSRFSTARMLREYFEKAYLPAAHRR